MGTFTQLDVLFVSVLLVMSVSLLSGILRKRRLPYPPGPKRLPIIGNLLDMPSREEWVTYKEWSEKFGSDVIHVDVLGSHIVILNSERAANELLERRSSIYSDRLGMDFNIGLLPYGGRWRRLRRAFHAYFHSGVAKTYRPTEMKAVHHLLRALLSTPDNVSGHLRHLAGQTILSIAYGIDVLPEGDPHIAAAEQIGDVSSLASESRAMLFDQIPWLVYMPSWFPGAGFKKEARKWKPVVASAIAVPHAEVKEALDAGTAGDSVTSKMLSQLDENSTEDDVWSTKAVPGIMYLAGAETTVSSLRSFVLAMVLYPEVQQKARAEIDAVTSGLRLPDFSDQDELPYVNAVVKEVMRWHPVTPLAVPHRAMQNDVYDDYFIPAGSIIIPNAWAMMWEPTVFPEPERFKPERWLVPGAPRFPEYAFGFGRRVCPGRFMARDSVWATIAGMLAVFDIAPVKDAFPRIAYASGIVSHPEPFQARIHPRSEAAASLVRATDHGVV
ncbi:cytochrome P450 [Gloeopeniophorella convolvens]|nr:cytochrome P450 [Gloeopeniophorella convolvens]